ncbi:hypothetical protein [Staphylococcus pseudoxylosus]|uniref:hypothetical protein n=1 Tax=Staphylococcus pseudoxylosus TaxID=2282419 RepID=UPI00398B4714
MNRLDVKTVITIIGLISLMIFAFIFTIGYILSNIDPENKLEGYTIAISFIGIFATFGGAYLGALIAGKYSLKAVEEQNRMNKIEIVGEIQSVFLFSSEDLIKFYQTIFNYNGFDNRKAENMIYGNGNIDYEVAFDELSSIPSYKNGYKSLTMHAVLAFDNDDIQNIQKYTNMIETLIPKLHHLIIKNNCNDSLYYLNLIYILKQQIDKFNSYIDYEKQQILIDMRKIDVRIHLLDSFNSFLKVYNKIAKKEPSNLVKIIGF